MHDLEKSIFGVYPASIGIYQGMGTTPRSARNGRRSRLTGSPARTAAPTFQRMALPPSRFRSLIRGLTAITAEYCR